MYAYVGSYAGIASLDVIVCFEKRGDCGLFLRVVALEMDEMGEGRGGEVGV